MNQAEPQQTADEAYREQIRSNTLSELENIYAHLNRIAYPQRFEMVRQELETRIQALDAGREAQGDEGVSGAGFFRRLWASLVDLFIQALILGVLFLVWTSGTVLVQSFGAEEVARSGPPGRQFQASPVDQVMKALSDEGVWAALYFLAVLVGTHWKATGLLLLGVLLYKGLLMLPSWIRSGATPGMREAGIRLESRDGGRLSFKQALIRFWGQYLLFVLTVGVSGLWILWDRQKQALHDKLAGTRVSRAFRSWEKPLDVRMYD